MVEHRCGQCMKERPENAFDINSNGRRMRSCKQCLVGTSFKIGYEQVLTRDANKQFVTNRRGGDRPDSL